MANAWIRVDKDSSVSEVLLETIGTSTYEQALHSSEIVAFDLGSIPRKTAVDEDAAVLVNLLCAESRGNVLYVGTPVRNLVAPRLEVVNRGSFGVFGFVSTGAPSIS